MNPAHLVPLLRETFIEWQNDNATRLGAALAYYTVFAIAPLVVIAVAIAGAVFGEQAARGELKTQIEKQAGPTIAQAIQDTINHANESGAGTLATIIGIGVLLAGATSLFNELHDDLNIIWKVKPKSRQFLVQMVKDRFIAFLVVVGTGLLLLASQGISVAVTALAGYVDPGLVPGGTYFWRVWNWALSLFLLSVLFAMIYKILPDVFIRWKDVWLGAILTAVLFSVGNHLIGWYLAYGSVASAYGAAGSLVVVLVWVYYSSQVVLFGAEFTQVYAKRHGHTAGIDPAARPETHQ